MHVAAIQANGEWEIGSRQRVPVALTPFGKHGLLGTELAFQTLGRGERVQPHR